MDENNLQNAARSRYLDLRTDRMLRSAARSQYSWHGEVREEFACAPPKNSRCTSDQIHARVALDFSE